MHLLFMGRDIMRDRITLSIEGMHCEGCVRRVTDLQGVKRVEPGSVEVGSALMSFDPEWASAGEITTAVNRIGFTARVEKK